MTDHNEHNLLIDIKDLTWWYPETPSMIFHKYNFHLYKNDFSVLTWKSGCGKSTLLKFILGEIKAPLRTIYHKREDMSRYKENELQLYRRKVGAIFQDYKLMDELSAEENIIYPLKLYEVPEHTIERKFNTLKNKLWLHHIVKTPVKLLSSGEKQKIAIARALIHNPEFIIADEPTGNMDRESTQQIADLLIEVNRMWNTILLITHDIHLLEYLKLKHKISLQKME